MCQRMLVGCLLLLAGCGRPPRYNVYVTGYTGGAQASIAPGVRIAVLENPGAANPLLEHEVAEKARRALAARGFRPASPLEADVAVTLKYGADTVVDHGEELRFVPGQTSTLKDSTGKVIGTVTSDASLVPQQVASTRHVVWLTMTALDRHGLADSAANRRPLWIGESRSSGANLPLRSMIDVLLVPASAMFGRNQLQSREIVRADDAALAALRAP